MTATRTLSNYSLNLDGMGYAWSEYQRRAEKIKYGELLVFTALGNEVQRKTLTDDRGKKRPRGWTDVSEKQIATKIGYDVKAVGRKLDSLAEQGFFIRIKAEDEYSQINGRWQYWFPKAWINLDKNAKKGDGTFSVDALWGQTVNAYSFIPTSNTDGHTADADEPEAVVFDHTETMPAWATSSLTAAGERSTEWLLADLDRMSRESAR